MPPERACFSLLLDAIIAQVHAISIGFVAGDQPSPAVRRSAMRSIRIIVVLAAVATTLAAAGHHHAAELDRQEEELHT
jgi:hypothetical protein